MSEDDAPVRAPRLDGLPPGFVWGAATSAAQVEGAADARGPSIWDTFAAHRGRVRGGATPAQAGHHLSRYREDVALLRRLGVQGYRFSFAWPRLQPEGAGRLDRAGLSVYDRLVDELLEAGIEPWATLYHWDLPQPLQDAGGWPERDLVDRFTDYATSVHAALGDRVCRWFTLDDPFSAAWLGYGAGVHAPGEQDPARAARAAHHLVLAHGYALAGMRGQAPADHDFGVVLDLPALRPAPGLTDDPEPAAQVDLLDGLRTRWWLDALLLGRYPDDVLTALEPYLAGSDGAVHLGDLSVIAQPVDVLGLTYPGEYPVRRRTSDRGRVQPDLPGTAELQVGRARVGEAGEAGEAGEGVDGPDGAASGLRDVLVRIARQYPPVPLVVAGCGVAVPDSRSALQVREGHESAPVPDPARVLHLYAHLEAAAQAVADGVDLRGFFASPLLDGFDWADGMTQRGLVRVDPDTGDRRLRGSYLIYRDLIAGQRAPDQVLVVP